MYIINLTSVILEQQVTFISMTEFKKTSSLKLAAIKLLALVSILFCYREWGLFHDTSIWFKNKGSNMYIRILINAILGAISDLHFHDKM